MSIEIPVDSRIRFSCHIEHMAAGRPLPFSDSAVCGSNLAPELRKLDESAFENVKRLYPNARKKNGNGNVLCLLA
jgi:hypothetical protein